MESKPWPEMDPIVLQHTAVVWDIVICFSTNEFFIKKNKK